MQANLQSINHLRCRDMAGHTGLQSPGPYVMFTLPEPEKENCMDHVYI